MSNTSCTSDAQLLRLGAVEMGEKLRHAGVEVGEDALQRRILGRLRLDLRHHLVERGIALVGAVLHFQLEAADGAQPLNRRRREDGDDGVIDAGEFGLQPLGDRVARQIGRTRAGRTASA